MEGCHSKNDGMWYLDIHQKPSKSHETTPRQSNFEDKSKNKSLLKSSTQANSVCEMKKKKDVVQLLSGAMWNPVPETWIQAIDAGFFATWPGLTSALVRKHLPPSIETTKGHMRADHSNVRSTKAKNENLMTTKDINNINAKV